MRSFTFNKVFVIESIQDDEKKNGFELYQDILRYKPLQTGEPFSCEFAELNNISDFHNFFDNLKKEIYKGLKPILHFEIHGLDDKSGLSLKNDDIISYPLLTHKLSEINQLIGNNLFLTLAVCHGAYLLGNVSIDKPAPFLGFIGSFEEIYNSDSLLRYSDFYDEFLSSFHLGKAIKRFLQANALNPNNFNLIETEETFKSVYKKYLIENTTKTGIKERWKNSIVDQNLFFASRKSRRIEERKFFNEIIKTKQLYFIKHRNIFFMLHDFPENESRFQLPKKFSEIL